jgi:ribosomal protein S18 acetylase RimI-like enzyme
MNPADLPDVERIGARVHPDHPEEPAVFAERLGLFPAGCLVLAGPAGLLGYTIAHPWRFGQPPSLDTLLGALPERPDTFYIHDIALLPETRRSGAGRAAVGLLTAQAAALGLPTVSLVAIGGSHGFWQGQGFCTHREAGLDAKLATYGPAARFMVRPLA